MTTVCVRFATPGYHNWPGATERRGYLANRHRHLFVVYVWLEVKHDDRDVEFHDLLSFAGASFSGEVVLPVKERTEGFGPYRELGPMSCEMMARQLREKVMEKWPRRYCKVAVSEDGEVGAEVDS